MNYRILCTLLVIMIYDLLVVIIIIIIDANILKHKMWNVGSGAGYAKVTPFLYVVTTTVS